MPSGSRDGMVHQNSISPIAVLVIAAEVREDVHLDGHGAEQFDRTAAVVVGLDRIHPRHCPADHIFLGPIAAGEVGAYQPADGGTVVAVVGLFAGRFDHPKVDIGVVGVPGHDDADVDVEEFYKPLVDGDFLDAGGPRLGDHGV